MSATTILTAVASGDKIATFALTETGVTVDSAKP